MSEDSTFPTYDVRECRGHWHITVGDEDIHCAGKPLSESEAREVAARRNAGETWEAIERDLAPAPRREDAAGERDNLYAMLAGLHSWRLSADLSDNNDAVLCDHLYRFRAAIDAHTAALSTAEREVAAASALLERFGRASGLIINEATHAGIGAYVVPSGYIAALGQLAHEASQLLLARVPSGGEEGR